MNTAYIYLQLYKLFDDVTPVPVDCGRFATSLAVKVTTADVSFSGRKSSFYLINP